jgi:hypothetical protein
MESLTSKCNQGHSTIKMRIHLLSTAVCTSTFAEVYEGEVSIGFSRFQLDFLIRFFSTGAPKVVCPGEGPAPLFLNLLVPVY